MSSGSGRGEGGPAAPALRGDSPPATTVVPSAPALGTPLTVGQLLGGRYEIRGVQGRGGMGEVWLARDVKLQVEVARKVVRSERLADLLALARRSLEIGEESNGLLREALAGLKASHPQ